MELIKWNLYEVTLDRSQKLINLCWKNN